MQELVSGIREKFNFPGEEDEETYQEFKVKYLKEKLKENRVCNNEKKFHDLIGEG